jgi:hypothetical protein
LKSSATYGHYLTHLVAAETNASHPDGPTCQWKHRLVSVRRCASVRDWRRLLATVVGMQHTHEEGVRRFPSKTATGPTRRCWTRARILGPWQTPMGPGGGARRPPQGFLSGWELTRSRCPRQCWYASARQWLVPCSIDELDVCL